MNSFFRPVFFVFALACLVCAGCSSFNRDWKKAVAQPPATNDVVGAWKGSWSSDANGHSGELRCLLEKISDEKYLARFDSTYQKILHFKSNVIFTGATTNQIFQFSGSAKLPWWAGGIYHYAGHVDLDNFLSSYHNKYDYGTFQMKRPE